MRYLGNVECKYAFIGDMNENVPKMYDQIDMIVSGASRPYNVPIFELNKLLPIIQDRKTLIKLDIEGNEGKALGKASELIKLRNVDWIIDLHPCEGCSRTEILQFFAEQDKLKFIENILEVIKR